MSCKVTLVSLGVFAIAARKRVALLEYLSSGLNLAGCADFVTSPAWTCNEAEVSVQGRVLLLYTTRRANLIEGVQSLSIRIQGIHEMHLGRNVGQLHLLSWLAGPLGGLFRLGLGTATFLVVRLPYPRSVGGHKSQIYF